MTETVVDRIRSFRERRGPILRRIKAASSEQTELNEKLVRTVTGLERHMMMLDELLKVGESQ